MTELGTGDASDDCEVLMRDGYVWGAFVSIDETAGVNRRHETATPGDVPCADEAKNLLYHTPCHSGGHTPSLLLRGPTMITLRMFTQDIQASLA